MPGPSSSAVRPANGRPTLPVLGPRPSTQISWHQAVERAVGFMREHMADQVGLEVLAQAASFSPYHFNRIFRLVTGIPPGQFLTALRMAEAKRLLLATSQRVTDVCFAVGFESLGTFTTRFGQLVGVAPQELRRLAELHGRRSIASLADDDVEQELMEHRLLGWLDAPTGDSCVALVGLFDRAVPQGLPTACNVVGPTPGFFEIAGVTRGSHHVLAVGFPRAQTVLDATLLEPQRLLVGALPQAVRVGDDPSEDVYVRLLMALPGPLEPPIVLAAPLLAAEAKAAASSSWRRVPQARTG
jgi:AraC family transcriptional regulator